jgi:hypothetical protein
MKKHIEFNFSDASREWVDIIFEAGDLSHRDAFLENINEADAFEVIDINGDWHTVNPDLVKYIKVSDYRGE